MPGPTGVAPRWLADDFYFIVYDLHARRLRVSERVARLGLASALLAELVLCGAITVEQRRVWVERRLPPDALAHLVRERIALNPNTRLVCEWLDVLSGHSYEDVVDRLTRAGHVECREVRRWLRSTVVYEPADLKVADWPESHIANVVAERQNLFPPEAVLAGLLVATGLDVDVFEARSDTRFVRGVVAQLDESLRKLLAETEAAVGAAVLDPRN